MGAVCPVLASGWVDPGGLQVLVQGTRLLPRLLLPGLLWLRQGVRQLVEPILVFSHPWASWVLLHRPSEPPLSLHPPAAMLSLPTVWTPSWALSHPAQVVTGSCVGALPLSRGLSVLPTPRVPLPGCSPVPTEQWCTVLWLGQLGFPQK